MTPAQRRALDRLARQARTLSPELVAAILQALRLVRQRLPVAEVERLIRVGRIADAIDAAAPADLIERALNPASLVLTDGVLRGMRGTAPLLPARAREIAVAFNTLNPRIVDAIRALDTTAIRSLVPEIRDGVRTAIEQGIRDGVNPRTMARGLRETIGLPPRSAEAVRRFRAEMESGDRAALRRVLGRGVIRTPDGTLVTRANHAGGFGVNKAQLDALGKQLGTEPLSPERIDKLVAAYERRLLAQAAETHARTAALDAQKVGQQLAWQEAKASGALGDAEIVAVWVTNLDGRERPEHAAMNGATRPIDGAYSTGQTYPGEGEYNCRCSEIFRVVKPSFALAA